MFKNYVISNVLHYPLGCQQNELKSMGTSPASKLMVIDLSSRPQGIEGTTNKNEDNHHSLTHPSAPGTAIHVLFCLKNYTYVEIRDCSIFSHNQSAITDAAFMMNEKDIGPSADPDAQYRGILNCIIQQLLYQFGLSVKSCTINNFSYGFLAGSNSILSIELSSIADVRHMGVISINPKILKISGTMFDNQPESLARSGIQLLYKSTSQKLMRKVLIEENRLLSFKESAIKIQPYDGIDGKTVLNSYSAIKIQKNRVYGNFQGIMCRGLAFQEFEILICDCSHNQVSNLMIQDCRIAVLTTEKELQVVSDSIVVSKTRLNDSLDGPSILLLDCYNLKQLIAI